MLIAIFARINWLLNYELLTTKKMFALTIIYTYVIIYFSARMRGLMNTWTIKIFAVLYMKSFTLQSNHKTQVTITKHECKKKKFIVVVYTYTITPQHFGGALFKLVTYTRHLNFFWRQETLLDFTCYLILLYKMTKLERKKKKLVCKKLSHKNFVLFDNRCRCIFT